LLAASLAAFLLLVGLDEHSLPFPPESEFSDAVTSHWPGALYLRESILDDHAFPLWRPLIMSGQPFAANPLNKVWYPFQWLVLLIDPIAHLNLQLWLHLLLGGMGMWAWARRTGLHPWPAALAAVGAGFAPRLIAAAGAGHLDLVYAAAWMPWLLWSVHRLVRPDPARGAVLAVGIIAAMCFLADVRLSAYAFVTTAAYALWLWAQQPDLCRRLPALRLIARIGTAALVAAGLTAVEWIPLLLLRADLSRTSMRIEDAAVDSINAGQWIGLVIGSHGGAWETLVYPGVSVLILAIVALLLRPKQLWFWGAWVLLLALYAMGDQFVLWTALVKLIPPLLWWRVPSRVWIIAALILPYLAAWGVQSLIAVDLRSKTARLSAVALLGGGLTCSLSGLALRPENLDPASVMGTLALPAIGLLVLLAVFRRAPSRLLLPLFVVVVAADLLWIDPSLIEGRSTRAWLDPYRDLALTLKHDGATRVYSPSYSLPQQASAYWDIPQFGGVDPFQIETYVEAAEAATGVRSEGYSVTIPAYASGEASLDAANRDATLRADLLAQWDVSHVVAAYPLEADGLALIAQVNGIYVYRNLLLPDAALDWHGPNRVAVRTDAEQPRVLYAIAAGRWQNASGDSPGLPGAIEPGVQTWTYRYSASEIWIGLLTGGGLLVAAGLLAWSTRYATTSSHHAA
jgi:hypothetical protein